MSRARIFRVWMGAMNAGTCLIGLLTAAVMSAAPAAAVQPPLTLTAGFGATWAAGTGSDALDGGPVGHVDALRPAAGGQWLVRVGHPPGRRTGATTPYGYWSGGNVYPPTPDRSHDRDWRFTSLED